MNDIFEGEQARPTIVYIPLQPNAPMERRDTIQKIDPNDGTERLYTNLARPTNVHFHVHNHQHAHIYDYTNGDAFQAEANLYGNVTTSADMFKTADLVKVAVVLRTAGLIVLLVVGFCVIGNCFSQETILHPFVAVGLIISSATMISMSFARPNDHKSSQQLTEIAR